VRFLTLAQPVEGTNHFFPVYEMGGRKSGRTPAFFSPPIPQRPTPFPPPPLKVPPIPPIENGGGILPPRLGIAQKPGEPHRMHGRSI